MTLVYFRTTDQLTGRSVATPQDGDHEENYGTTTSLRGHPEARYTWSSPVLPLGRNTSGILSVSPVVRSTLGSEGP